jgi:hypothetical protein
MYQLKKKLFAFACLLSLAILPFSFSSLDAKHGGPVRLGGSANSRTHTIPKSSEVQPRKAAAGQDKRPY